MMRVLSLPLLSIAVVVVAGCSRDSSGSPQKQEVQRSEGLTGSESIPELIDSLENPSPEVRQASRRALEQRVGAGVVFRPYDPPEKRAAAIATYRRLRDLADEHGEQYFIDLMPILLDRMENGNLEVRDQAWHDVRQLTGMSSPFRADDPPAVRQKTIDYYRDLWAKWQDPKSRILEFKRHPETLREQKREWAEELRRRTAAASN